MRYSGRTPAADLAFRFEDDLCGVLQREMPRLFSNRSGPVRTLVERGVGAVIPDVIIVASGEDGLLRRSRPLTMFEAVVLAELSADAWTSPDQVAGRLFAQEGRVRSTLDELVRIRLAVSNEYNEFGVYETLLPPHARIISVEAKLRRWREAVEQAASYQAFSDQSYVALPAEIVVGNEALKRASRCAGIGIVAVDENSIEVQLEAHTRTERRGEWLWLYSRARAEHDGRTI